jgi:hypothetical protein
MQEVIVYRNPMEAAMWHSIMSADFPYMLFTMLMFIVAVTLFALQDKYIGRKWWYSKFFNWFIGATLLVSGAASYFILV